MTTGSLGYNDSSIVGYNPGTGWFSLDDLFPTAGPDGGIAFTQVGTYFTAPSSGIYHVQVDASIRSARTTTELRLMKNGSALVKDHLIKTGGTDHFDFSMSVQVVLSEGNTITLEGDFDGTNQIIVDDSTFLAIRTGDSP